MQKSKASINLRISVFCAFLTAFSIVFGKYLAINLGEVLRISFENLPIIFAGMAFGPIYGALTGLLSDLVGCMLVGYAVNPLVTCGAALVGLAAGLYRLLISRMGGVSRLIPIALTVFASHLIGSVLVKTAGLAAYYEMPYIMLFLWRSLNYLLVGAFECTLLFLLFKNSRIKSEIKKLNGGGAV